MLVVTKADLGQVALRARRDLQRGAALARRARHAGRRRVLDPAAAAASTSWSTALDAHRAGLDLAAARTRARRLGALADFVAEHGERGLRALGGPPGRRALARPSRTPRSTSRR